MSEIVTALRARANARRGVSEPSPTAELCAEAADHIEALEAALKPFAEAWRQAVECASGAPLGAINNLTTYFIGAGHYQAAARCFSAASAEH